MNDVEKNITAQRPYHTCQCVRSTDIWYAKKKTKQKTSTTKKINWNNYCIFVVYITKIIIKNM